MTKVQSSTLREPLVDVAGKNEEEKQASFNVEETKIMCGMAWPMLVSFFCRMAMASVDSAFVGHINQGGHSPGTYLAAAGLSDMVVNILVIPPLAFNQSLNALVSQAMGSGNKKMAGIWLQLSLFWLTISYIPCLVSFFFVGDILHLLGFSPEICALSGAYAKFNVVWPIPNGWYQCMRFYFQAQGNTRPAMYNNMLFLCVNIFLNWLFVFGGPFRHWCGWQGFGFVGAAMSLSCSRSLQPLAYWLYMFVYKRAHEDTWPGWSRKIVQYNDNTKAFLKQSLPQVGTLILQATMNQTTTLMIAQLGNLAIAASAATTALTQIFTGGLGVTCNNVCGIRVGFHLGQQNGWAARKASVLIFGISAVSVSVIAVVLLPFRHQAMAIMTSDVEVQNLSAQLLLPVLLNTFASMIVQCNTGGVFTSQGRTTLATLLSMGVELPLNLGSIATCVFVLHLGIVAVYYCQAVVFWFELAIVMVIWQFSDWQKYADQAVARQRTQAASPSKTPNQMGTPGILDQGGMLSSPNAREKMEFAYSSPVPLPTQPLLLSPNARSLGEEAEIVTTIEEC